MTSVLLLYVGDPTTRVAAEDRLRRLLRNADLVRKTDNLVEANLDPSQAALLEKQLEWKLSRPSFADFNRPKMNLDRARAKLMKK